VKTCNEHLNFKNSQGYGKGLAPGSISGNSSSYLAADMVYGRNKASKQEMNFMNLESK
jgi:hypothetical protein